MPTGLTITPAGSTRFNVGWTDNSVNELGFDLTDGVEERRVGANTTSYAWSVAPGTYKCVRVRAFNWGGVSDWFPNTSPYYVCASTPG
jgi:hypothetical protein